MRIKGRSATENSSMPEWLTLTLKILSGPLIGAVIGLFTNWLAVHMLFHPRSEVRLGRFRLPFAPGIIPKRRRAIAHALGNAVGSALVTAEDISRLLTSEEMKERVSDMAADAAFGSDGGLIADAEARERVTGAVSGIITDKLIGVIRAALPSLCERADELIPTGGLLRLLGGKRLSAALATAAGTRLDGFLRDKGYQTLLPAVSAETEKALAAPLSDTAEKMGLDREKVRDLVGRAYERVIAGRIAAFLGSIDIAGMVESKINEMDIAELERLLMSVMKRELRAIVRLGGVLGGVVGIVNSLIILFV